MNDKLFFLAKTIEYIQKTRVSAQVRKTHLAKNNKTCDLTEATIEKMELLEDWLNSKMKEMVKEHPAYFWFSKVKGIGDLNIGKVIGLVNIERADNISKLWRYAGFGVQDGKGERRIVGEDLHFNMTLKTMCWRLGKSLIRAKGAYYNFYLEQKRIIGQRVKNEGKKIVPSAELPKQKGKHIENDEFFGLGHVDMMAMRKMIKLFLSHLWLKWREAENLEITKPYAHAIQGHENYLSPEDFIE
jgi:hypothetical protein